jgi:hypothetical protein
MDRDCWRAARERAETAKDRLAAFLAANPEDLRAHLIWEDFLTDLTKAYNKIFAGERIGEPSAKIIQKIRTERKSDEFLAYMREARNAADHGIEKVSNTTFQARPLRPDEAFPPVILHTTTADGKEQQIRMTPDNSFALHNPKYILCDFELGGRRYRVPQSCMGTPLLDLDPQKAGHLALSHLTTRLQELEPLLSN